MTKRQIIPHVGTIEAFRHSSHTPKSAIADIIDNSIDANASVIDLYFSIRKGVSQLIIADNGDGMDETTLLKAFRFGDHGEKISGELGRFGVGLKSSAMTLGESFSILTKTSDGPLLKGVYDPEEIIKSGEWDILMGETAEEDDINLFKEYIKEEESGTMVIINDLSKNSANMSQFADSVKNHLGRTFRYFLPSSSEASSKIKISVNDSEILSVDPLERQAPGTQTVDKDVETKFGTVHVIISTLSKEHGDADKSIFNYEPNTFWQGFYIVRENREIMFADTALLRSIWGEKHPTGNYIRVEIRYPSTLDNVFYINHDKSSLKGIEQSVYDALREFIYPVVSQWKSDWRSRVSKDISQSPELKKILEGIEKKVKDKANVLDMPNNRSIRRSRGNKKGTIQPKGTDATRTGDGSVKKTKVGNFKIGMVDLGQTGEAFAFAFEGNLLRVDWNTSHPFVQKYITVSENSGVDTVASLNYLVFALAAQYEKEILKSEDNWEVWQNFLGGMSTNLRILAD